MSTVFDRTPFRALSPALVIPEVLGHLGLERGLQHPLRQPGEQPVRADEADAFRLRFREQLLGDLLLIDDLPGQGSIISMTSVIAFPSGQVTGYRLNEPLGNLFAAEAAHAAATAGMDEEAIQAAYATNTGTKQKTAPKGGLLNSTSATTAWAYLFTASSLDGDSNKPHMVELGELKHARTRAVVIAAESCGDRVGKRRQAGGLAGRTVGKM